MGFKITILRAKKHVLASSLLTRESHRHGLVKKRGLGILHRENHVTAGITLIDIRCNTSRWMYDTGEKAFA